MSNGYVTAIISPFYNFQYLPTIILLLCILNLI